MESQIEQLNKRIQLLENLIFVLIKSDKYYFSKHLTFVDGMNISAGTGTGTKIATGITQKLGFFNATPIIQPSSTGEDAGFSAGGGTTVTHQATFTGNTGSTAYKIGDIVKHLKLLGFLLS